MRLRGQLLLVFVTVSLGGALVGLLSLFSSPAAAQADEPRSEPTPEPPDLRDYVGRREAPDFFSLYPAGEGEAAQSYDDLGQEDSPGEESGLALENPPSEAELEGGTSKQAALDNAGLWAETGNGHEVHSKWGRASAEHRRRGKAKRAQQLSGTQGLDALGVN